MLIHNISWKFDRIFPFVIKIILQTNTCPLLSGYLDHVFNMYCLHRHFFHGYLEFHFDNRHCCICVTKFSLGVADLLIVSSSFFWGNFLISNLLDVISMFLAQKTGPPFNKRGHYNHHGHTNFMRDPTSVGSHIWNEKGFTIPMGPLLAPHAVGTPTIIYWCSHLSSEQEACGAMAIMYSEKADLVHTTLVGMPPSIPISWYHGQAAGATVPSEGSIPTTSEKFCLVHLDRDRLV